MATLDPETKKKCSDLLEHFFKMDATEPFWERVNWEEWGLYDYLSVVKVPMDMGTIRSKLAKNEYKKAAEFARDMRLVWDNCKLYNQDGSELYQIADELSKKFEDRLKFMKLDVGPRPDRSIPAPSTDEKIAFCQNIYLLPAKELRTVMEMLDDQCPKAVDRSAPDELEILIDNVDTKTFRELEKFLVEKIPESAREPVTPKSSKKSSSSKRSSASSASGSAKKSKSASSD